MVKDNYFDEKYLKLDVLAGVITNTSGNRLIALTEDFLVGFKKAVEDETGDSYKIVFHTCGREWGKGYAKKFKEEIKKYYNKDLSDLPIFTIDELFKGMWTKNGWGEIKVNWKEAFGHGVFEIEIKNPSFSSVIGNDGELCDQIFEGLIESLFSDLFSKELKCVQTSNQKFGFGSMSKFILSIPQRMKDAEGLVDSKSTHEKIFEMVKNKQV